MYMKSIYLVMSQTGSILSRTIKLFTGHEYNHISISLDENLDCMYSFGRKYPNNPFIGVFVIEGVDRGTFLKFVNTRCRVIEIKVSDYQYDLICKNIFFMLDDINKYKYNLLGLFLAAFNICRHSDYKFYCSEFVRYILDISDVDVSMIPDIPHPNDFMSIDHNVLYEGLLKDYSYIRKKS